MANPPQPSLGYSGSLTPTQPDAPTLRPEKNSIPPPFPSPVAARFPPPRLQQEQIPSPSTRTPNLLSPVNGVKTGSPIPHLSTPPGPPVFSSPLRPAAVPFRTSPATPQPVAISSSSSLPTSSPPYYSNGSAELQHQVSDATEESLHLEKSPYVLFSADKVLKRKKQANVPSLGFGALVSPGREISPGQWQCAICRNLNGSGGEYVATSKEELLNYPELSSPMVDYVQTGNKRPGFIPVGDLRISAPIVLVIDECLDEAHLQHLQKDSFASADVLPGDKSPTQDSLKSLIYGTGIYLSAIHASLPVIHTIFSSLRPYKLNLPEASRDRCLGTAVENYVCAGGPNTYGPGSVPHSLSHPNYPHMEKSALKWMEHLGQEAHRQNTVVDILCAGTCPAFGVNLQRASTRAAGSHGLFEIRCSDDILITQVVGPGEEAHTDAHETFKNDTSLSIQMLSVEETQSFALSMETKGDIKSDYVFFQFAIQYSNVYQADISRVITVRLPTVDSVSAYLGSVQDDVAAVLIAKRTLLQAKNYSDAIDMRATIDERVKDITVKFGTQLPKSKLYRFPKELSVLPEHLFHLRRAPRCLMHREGGTFEELPAYDLAMQSDAAVVLDHGTDVFIWLGAELASDEGKSASALAACRTLAEELTESRFPAPRILAFKEGSSQARYFVSRLIPAHKDPPYEQEARFPQLRTLTADQRVKLKSSFLHFDDPSFCEWMRGLKLVPPEPS
ncbi:hypothetical protein CK203_017394 [Vitis vinifera]|uniref:Protein transport protein SEC23 n=1 Tax=Vitis vinifera TaxID=29760 RepID=A0A438IY57_VITVI|nr:hypothetical protein CK203_017394 [Vitis vinifera]